MLGKVNKEIEVQLCNLFIAVVCCLALEYCMPKILRVSSFTQPSFLFRPSPLSARFPDTILLHISYSHTANMSDTKPEPDSSEASTTSPAHTEGTPKDTTPAPAPTSYTEMASNAAGSATTAAVGVKDSVFSMFGGGAKKEKREEPDGETEDRSGSFKAKRDAEAAEAQEGGEVSFPSPCLKSYIVPTMQEANHEGLCRTGRCPRFPRRSLRTRCTLD